MSKFGAFLGRYRVFAKVQSCSFSSLAVKANRYPHSIPMGTKQDG